MGSPSIKVLSASLEERLRPQINFPTSVSVTYSTKHFAATSSNAQKCVLTTNLFRRPRSPLVPFPLKQLPWVSAPQIVVHRSLKVVAINSSSLFLFENRLLRGHVDCAKHSSHGSSLLF